MRLFKQIKKSLPLFVFITFGSLAYGQGNHVFSGSQFTNFGDVNLTTATSWSTDRSASPGYFTGVGSATYSGSSDAFNVNGYVRHLTNAANQGFDFPAGTGSDLRTLTTSGTIPSGVDYATAWIVGDPTTTPDPTDGGAFHDILSFAAPIQSVANVGQWDWQVLAGSANGVTVTVSIPDLSAVGSGVDATDVTDLRLVGWNGSQWVDLSGAATASGFTEDSTLSGTMIDGITAITIGAVTTVLPVDLVSFEAEVENCNAIITWKTETETNNSHFEVLRSNNGVDGYQVVAIVEGNGTTLDPQEYTFIDTPGDGTHYYRLRQIDFDGTSEFFNRVLEVQINCDDKLIVYPNPVRNGGVLNVQADDIKTIAIYDAIGRLLFVEEYPSDNDDATVPIRNFAPGAYILLVNSEKQIKFVVQ